MREFDHLGHVRQVVQAEPDRIRAEPGQLAIQLGPGVGLQVDDGDLVPGFAGGPSHPLQPQRLQPQEQL